VYCTQFVCYLFTPHTAWRCDIAKKKDSVGTEAVKLKSSRAPKSKSPTRKRASPVVGIGASAGGLEALERFFSHLPPDTGMAFVIVRHLDPTGHSSMPEILSRFTRMTVKLAEEGVKVRPNSIYLIPPNKSMGIQKGALFLQEPARPPALRLPVDFFFRSLAREKGADAIGVILSGTGTDGTLGVREIKAELGTVLAQDPASAKYDGMPRSAIDTGLVDLVLKPEEMAEKLIQFIKHLEINGTKFGAARGEGRDPLQQVFAILRTRTGHDFSKYKRATVRRRLQRRMSVNQISDISGYAKFIRENSEESNALLKDLLISVTSFFRDPEAFEELKPHVKEIITNKPEGIDFRVWVAGCATGEEAYSMAIIISECLDELNKSVPVQMYGTDIDIDALQIGRAGMYPANIAADVTPDRLQNFFIREKEAYRVKKELREKIIFAPQNFIKDPPFSRMDLICCRNLLIYLDSEVQKTLLPLLHHALTRGGILFLGPSETTGEASDLFITLNRKWKIFQRREVVVPAERLRFPSTFTPYREYPESAEQDVPRARILELTERIFLDRYAPTFAVIDHEYRLVCVRCRTGKYLEIASGQTDWTILDMAREGLRTELSSAIIRANAEKKKTVREGIRVKTNGESQTITLTVAPLHDPGLAPGLSMVVFQETGEAGEQASGRRGRGHRRATELEDELKLTKENLQNTIDELEATNEELKSANEELQSNNEELQSTNEELDTSGEELQSLNEELTTVNAELRDNNELLIRAKDDLKNFLNRTDIAIIFLDDQLNIRSYTPATTDVYNIKEIDIGRPLEDLTSRLAYSNVSDDARNVLRTVTPKEIEVQRRDGHWYTMRILPYLTVQNALGGLVISFLDIDKQKQGAAELLRLNRQLEELARFPQENPNPVMRAKKDGSILYANAACSQLEGRKYQAGETLPRQYREAIAAVLEADSPQTIEAKGKEREFTLNFVPVTKGAYVNIYGSDITSLKKAEESLREARDYLDNLINYASAPIVVWNPEFRITRFNHAFEELTGRIATEIIGKKLDVLLPPDQRDDHLAKVRQAGKKGAHWDAVEVPVQHADGSVRTVLWNSATLLAADAKTPLSTIAQGLDITERKKAQEEQERLQEVLADRLNELQTVLDNAPIAIWICRDPECRTITGNIYANKLFGVSQGTNISRTAFPAEAMFDYRVLHDGIEVKSQELPAQVAATTGKPVEPDEFEIIFEDGRHLYMLIGAVPLVDRAADIRGAVAVGADITEQKQQMDIKDEFIGMVSHELRTPLTVVIGALTTATDERVSKEEKEELIEEATSSAESLASILTNMLELSRYQAGRLNLERKPIRISDIAKKAAQRARRKYDTHNIILDVSDSAPDVDGDADRIEQVLYNLLENAVKYSPTGSKVRIFSRQDKEDVVIGIRDYGTGIAPDDQQKLFEPFSRLKEGGSSGIGLGLVVCKRLVEAHGGRIWVESIPGQGSTFLFTIPTNRKHGTRGPNVS
jgi:two-component system CheB/CheR fusion protein